MISEDDVSAKMHACSDILKSSSQQAFSSNSRSGGSSLYEQLKVDRNNLFRYSVDYLFRFEHFDSNKNVDVLPDEFSETLKPTQSTDSSSTVSSNDAVPSNRYLRNIISKRIKSKSNVNVRRTLQITQNSPSTKNELMQTANDATTYCLSRNAPTRRAKRWNVEKNASEVCNDEKVHVSPQVHNQRSTPNDQQNKTERSTFRSKKIVDVDKEECGIHFYEEIESNPITNDALPNFLPPVPALPLIRPMKLFPPDRTFQPKYAYHRYQQYWKDKQYLIEKMTNNGNGCDKR